VCCETLLQCLALQIETTSVNVKGIHFATCDKFRLLPTGFNQSCEDGHRATDEIANHVVIAFTLAAVHKQPCSEIANS
jgi:hypothetical protein